MFGDMMGKLQEMQRAVEQSKQKLDTISVTGESGYVKVEVSGNRRVKKIVLNQEPTDKEELEDLLIIALNKALEQADKVNEAEMASSARGLIPGF
jgi:nucleoid-associated protein EbfC